MVSPSCVPRAFSRCHPCIPGPWSGVVPPLLQLPTSLLVNPGDIGKLLVGGSAANVPGQTRVGCGSRMHAGPLRALGDQP